MSNDCVFKCFLKLVKIELFLFMFFVYMVKNVVGRVYFLDFIEKVCVFKV